MKAPAVAVLAIGLFLGIQDRPAPPAETRLLFIGNSLTIANGLPDMVAAIGRAGGRPVTCETVAFNDFSLEDHWQQGDARRAIARGGWSIVVLQQGPSALPESQASLRAYTKRFDGEIRRVGARTALYMVWPSRARKGDFAGVSRSYSNAAKDVNGLLFPAGDAWQAAWKRDSTLALYGPDTFHPSVMGTYLAALVITEQALGITPAGLPSPGLPPGVTKLLQDAAAEADAGVGR